MPVRELDRSHDDRHRLDPARPLMRESLAFVVPLPAEGIGVIAYTWVDAHGQAGTFGMAFGPGVDGPIWEKVDGVAVPDEMTFDDWRVGPMHFGHVEPLHRSRIAFAHDRIRMDLTFSSIHVPYAFSSHPDGFPSYWADDRFEQSGRAHGTVVIDGREIPVDGPAHRDHSFGARAWAATTHYKWLNFLADDAAVHVFDLQGYGRRTVRGYVFRDGHTAEIVDADFDYELDADFFHRRLTARLTDDAGRTTTARLTAASAELDYRISPRLELLDIVGTCEIEGTPGVAFVEMAWPPDYLEANREATGG